MPSSAPVSDIGRALLVVGGILVLAGLVLVSNVRIPFLGRLPGDIFIHRDGFTFAFPLVTCLLLSVGLTVLLNLLARIFR